MGNIERIGIQKEVGGWEKLAQVEGGKTYRHVNVFVEAVLPDGRKLRAIIEPDQYTRGDWSIKIPISGENVVAPSEMNRQACNFGNHYDEAWNNLGLPWNTDPNNQAIFFTSNSDNMVVSKDTRDMGNGWRSDRYSIVALKPRIQLINAMGAAVHMEEHYGWKMTPMSQADWLKS